MKISDMRYKLMKYCKELEIIRNLSKQTVKNYCTTNKMFISYLEDNNINELDNIEEILKDYIIYMKQNNNNSYSTINKYMQQIIQFLEYLGLKVNITLPKDNTKDKKIKYLKVDEINEVAESIPESFIRDKAIYQTLFRTGLRVSELCNLTKQDIDLNSKEEVTAINIINGKGGKDRTVYIDQDTLKLINKMIYKRTRKNKPDENNYLFQTRTKNKMGNRDIENVIKKYAIATDKRLKEQGQETNYKDKLTPHTLRHSFTIYLLNEAGRPINEVQQLLGHSSITTTQIYSKVDNKQLKKGYSNVKW